MSKSYPDLPLTNFPESTDAQKVYEDVGINTVDDMNLYYQYIHAKNFAAANQLLADKPLLQRCIVNALSLNTMEHRLLALQRMYLSDFKAYIENDVTREDILEMWTYSKEAWEAAKSMFLSGVSELDDTEICCGQITGSGGTVTFSRVFSEVPRVVASSHGNNEVVVQVTNVTKESFSYSVSGLAVTKDSSGNVTNVSWENTPATITYIAITDMGV